MSNILEIKNISKSFKDYSSEFKRILSWFGFNFQPTEEHHVLKDINFSVAPGEAVGIIGLNGAGKSTLLKIITGTLKPSTGSVHIGGRVSAILELGMGFQPDMTGRQNVYHSAGLMGFTNEQIDIVINEIEEFAEIGEYFDQPSRIYSSGMQVRVAFAVATAYRPEILIIDEALSVGDSYFQHKSFERINSFQKQGTSLLFVSHDKAAILALCNKAILLKSGKIEMSGEPELVMDYYNALIIKKNDTVIEVTEKNNKTTVTSGNKYAYVESIKLFNSENKTDEMIKVGDDINLVVKVKIEENIKSLTLGYMIKDRTGQEIFGTNTKYTRQVLQECKKNETYEFIIGFKASIGAGSYSISTALVDTDGATLFNNYEWNENALVFEVVNATHNHFVGSCWMPPNIKINKEAKQ